MHSGEIVGKAARVEDAAPCLTLHHTYTSVLSFPRDGGHTALKQIYDIYGELRRLTLNCSVLDQKQLEQEQERR